RYERLVLNGASQRRERTLIVEFLRAHEAIRTKQQVRTALVAPEDLHEHVVAVAARAEPGHRPTRVDTGRVEDSQRYARASHRVLDVSGPWAGARRARRRSGALPIRPPS